MSDDEKQSFWKKDLAFGRKPGDEPKPTDEPLDDLSAQLEAIKAAAAAAATPVPAAAPPIELRPESEPEPEPTPAPAPLAPAVVPTLELAPPPAPEPAPVPAPELAAVPEPAPEPELAAVPEPVRAAEPAGAPEPVFATTPAHAFESEPEPEPQPDAEPEQKVPFWKRELGPSRKSKQPKQPKAEQQQAPGDEPEQKVPFWKRELGSSRKSKEPKAEKPPKPKQEPKQTKESNEKPEAAGEPVPIWKREISFGKRRPARKPDAAPGTGRRRGLALKLPRLERPARAKRGSHVPKKIVGLKIGASQIAAARIANNGAAELVLAVREDLEPGIVVGGELREPEKLAEVIRDFFRKHKLPKRNVRLGIANNRIGVRTFEISGIDDAKQLDNAIKFRAQEALPIPIEDAVLDYQILSESKTEEGEIVKRVLLVVAYRELVDRYVSACRKAGIELVGIDLEAFALLRAMAAPRDGTLEQDAAVVVVAIGHDRSTFAVSDGRVCEFTRVLEWGGWSLNIALARALDKSPSEVEQLKRSLDLNATLPPDGMSAEQFEAVREAARRQIGSFARELVSSLQFYQNQPGSLGIAELVLTGGTAHLHGLAEELQRLIGVTVRVGDPLMRVRVGKKAVADDERVGSLAIAIGLGIED